MISKNFQKFPLRVHAYARVPMGALRGSTGDDSWISCSGAPRRNCVGWGKNLGSQKRPVRIAQALLKVI